MKKYTLMLAALLTLGFSQCNSDTTSHDISVLPSKAVTMLSNNFSSSVTLVETEKNTFGSKEYEVTLADGSEISFNGNGEWKQVETPNNLMVPAALIPKPIKEYVAKNHAGANIVGIEKNKKGYDVELSNGLEIQFNAQGGFLKYDK